MAISTALIFITEVCGYAKLYDHPDQGPGRWYHIIQFPFFITFADFPIYWFHRGFHHPLTPKIASAALFVVVDIWAILIHDSEYQTDNPIVNSAACHSLHRSKIEVIHGQFFTFLDRLCGSYRKPHVYFLEGEQRVSGKTWKRGAKEVGELGAEVEGVDERTYGRGTKKPQ